MIIDCSSLPYIAVVIYRKLATYEKIAFLSYLKDLPAIGEM